MAEAKNDTRTATRSDTKNDRLEHSAGGVTTRDDVTDLGVPMLPGDPKERQGPEDALGPGPKRGDYSRVTDSGYRPNEVVAVPDAKPGEPRVKVIDQAPRASNRGDEKGVKGGVDTTDDDE